MVSKMSQSLIYQRVRRCANLFWSDLEGIHRQIAAETGSPIHVLAGPGTGKTFAMIRRIARLLEDGVEPKRILAITFTRTAARDLKEQLSKLGIAKTEDVRAVTLHSFCYSILAREDVFESTQRKARPLLSFELNQLINDLASEFSGKNRTKKLLTAYEAAWARWQHEEAGAPQEPTDQKFQHALLDWLIFHRCMLIGELVPLTLSFSRQNPALYLLPEFDHVLVDEYQDLNKSDQTLVEALGQVGALIVIGDDNQSIYSFRHANPEGIRTFQKGHLGAIPFEISECQRCPPNIVSISNALISHDRRRSREIPLVPNGKRRPADIYIVQHGDVNEEIESIADFVDHYLNGHPDTKPGQILILATRRFIGNGIRDALISRKRNALSYFSEDAVEKPAAAEGFCLLNLLVSPDDRAALRAWIGLGSRDHGFAQKYARIREYAQNEGLEIREVLERLSQRTVQIPYTEGMAERYSVLKTKLHNISSLIGLELVRALWSPDEPETQDIRILAENLAVEHTEPAELFDALRQEITQPDLPASGSDIIRVMSLGSCHQSVHSLVRRGDDFPDKRVTR
jgi:superfamily I DNA/RNA helicase